jgi:hypothetical protein
MAPATTAAVEITAAVTAGLAFGFVAYRGVVHKRVNMDIRQLLIGKRNE